MNFTKIEKAALLTSAMSSMILAALLAVSLATTPADVLREVKLSSSKTESVSASIYDRLERIDQELAWRGEWIAEQDATVVKKDQLREWASRLQSLNRQVKIPEIK